MDKIRQANELFLVRLLQPLRQNVFLISRLDGDRRQDGNIGRSRQSEHRGR
jgi:hypothetical protein